MVSDEINSNRTFHIPSLAKGILCYVVLCACLLGRSPQSVAMGLGPVIQSQAGPDEQNLVESLWWGGAWLEGGSNEG
jgi:hypothetical protein